MKILVVIDMQKDFVDGVLGTPEAVSIVPNVVKRVKLAVELEEQILFTRDTHGENYLETLEGKKLPVPHCIQDTDGWQIIPELQEFSSKTQPIDKPTFGSMDLCEAMRIVQSRMPITQVTLIGLCTDICVLANAMLLKACLPETEIIVDASCCAGVTPESHATALAAMKGCQIVVENDSKNF